MDHTLFSFDIKIPYSNYFKIIIGLNMHWNGEYNIHNSENIRSLEKAVNYGFIDLLDEKGPEKYENTHANRQMHLLDTSPS